MKFTSKPVTIEAIQWTGDNAKEMTEWFKEHNKTPDMKVWIRRQAATKSQWLYVSEGTDWGSDPAYTAAVWDYLHSTWVGVKNDQWIICGTKDEFYPCDPDVFDSKYGPEGQKPELSYQTADLDTLTAIFWNHIEEQVRRVLDLAMANKAVEVLDAVNRAEDVEEERAEEVAVDIAAAINQQQQEDHDVTDLIRNAMDDARSDAEDTPIIQQAKNGRK